MSTLVVVAHPDDETLGCGGTIARLIAQGETVHALVFCKTRAAKQAYRAIPHLGANYLENMGYRDQCLDTFPTLSLTRWIEHHMRYVKPETVYTHALADLNEDHRIIHNATMIACRPVNDCPVRTLYAMEIPGSTGFWGDHSFHPTTYIDIAQTLDRKISAMEMYETEARHPPHPRSPEMLRALAHYRGSQAGLPAAEAFQLIRQIQTADP